MDDLLQFLLTEPLGAPSDSLESWRSRHLQLAERFATPVDLALAGGLCADRVAFAFASGYQAALHALVPSLPRERLAALCATEKGGGHPRAMHTRLSGSGPLQLDGEKTYITLGPAAELLLVVASQGQDAQGRNRLRLVQLEAHRPGATLTPLPPTPFVPELPHASLTLRAAPVAPEELLPGDGYERYVKPFRTVEDCHVHAALLGWLLRVARGSSWPAPVQEELLALAVSFRALAQAEPSSPAVHLALGGALDLLGQRLEACEPLWAQVEPATRERWERDRALLSVAGVARTRRREVARQRLSPHSPADPGAEY